MRFKLIGLGTMLCCMAALPAWPEAAGGVDIMRYYPKRALRLGIEGKVVLRCSITASSLLKHCRIVSETPASLGFGAAALKMSVLLRLNPTGDGAGAPTSGTVVVPIRFELPKPDPAQGQPASAAPVRPPR